jgi:hypothetical protein
VREEPLACTKWLCNFTKSQTSPYRTNCCSCGESPAQLLAEEKAAEERKQQLDAMPTFQCRDCGARLREKQFLHTKTCPTGKHRGSWSSYSVYMGAVDGEPMMDPGYECCQTCSKVDDQHSPCGMKLHAR